MKRTITLALSLFVCLFSFAQNTIFSTGFEGPGFDAGWTTGMTTNINQAPYDYPAGLDPWDMWDLTQEPLYVHAGYSAAYIGATLNLENKYDWLMSPQFLVPTNARTSVNYWMWYHSSTPSNWTWLYIMVYDVAEDTWEMGELILHEMNAPFHYIEEYAFDLTPWIGKDVKVAFAKRGTYQFAMDDISFTFIDDGNDLGVGAILSPDNQYGCTLSANEEIKIRIENTGTLDVSTFDLTYIINSAILVTETVNEEIKAGETLEYTFIEKADLSVFGDYTIDVEVIVEDDQDPGNNLRTTHVKSKDAEITVVLLTDFYENETSWEIVDENNTIIATNGALQKTSLHTDHVCVMSTGCYTFTIYDGYGDGISFGPTPGYLNVYYNGELVGGFSQDESNFGVEFKIDSIGNGCSGVNINSPFREIVKAYPNPVSGTLFLENLEEVTSVKIIDMLGREHTLQAEITGNRVSVDFSKFENGLYLVKINSKDTEYDSFLIQKR